MTDVPPLGEADDADVAEQARTLDDVEDVAGDDETAAAVPAIDVALEADPADYLEQHQPVATADDEDYPAVSDEP